MCAVSRITPIELIPPRQQVLWGWPAVINFFLGGLGGGVYAVAAAAAGFADSPAVSVAAWLGPALVLAGFIAVATEAGRPFRGPRVLARVGTSWMSRELWIGAAFVVLAGADLLSPHRLARVLAVVTALMLALAQGFILRRARAVPAWDVPIMPLVFVLSALISGAGLYLLIEMLAGRVPGLPVLGGVVALLAAGLAGWVRYVTGSQQEEFCRAVLALSHPRAATIIVGSGYVAPCVLLILAAAVPALRLPALVLAGASMIGVQLYAKALLILAAGQLRSVTLTGLRLERRLS